MMGLVDIFRVKVLDLSDHTLTIEVKSMMCLILQITYIITCIYLYLLLKPSIAKYPLYF